MASTVIMAHLSTLMSVLKVKLDGDSPEKHLALKANLICQVVQIWCYCHVEDSRYSFRQQYRPQTLHRQDHVWNDIVNTHCIYNNEEFLSVFRVTRSTFHRVITLIKDNLKKCLRHSPTETRFLLSSSIPLVSVFVEAGSIY